MFIKVRPAFSSGEEEVKKESLEWSLKPILMGMRLLGVDLTVSSVSVANSRWLNVYGLLCFVFNVFCNGTNCYRLAIVIIEVSGPNSRFNETSTMIWTIAIDNANFSLHSVGFHLALLLMAHSNWRELWTTFKQVARRFDLKFYERLRQYSSGAVLAIIFLVGKVIFYHS